MCDIKSLYVNVILFSKVFIIENIFPVFYFELS